MTPGLAARSPTRVVFRSVGVPTGNGRRHHRHRADLLAGGCKRRRLVAGQPLVKRFLRLLLASVCRLQSLDRRRQLVRQHRQQPNASRDRALSARDRLGARGAPQTNSTRSPPLNRSTAGNGDHADPACPPHVRAAAGGEIVILDLDDAELARARRILSKRQLRRLARGRRTSRTTSRSSHSTPLAASSTREI